MQWLYNRHGHLVYMPGDLQRASIVNLTPCDPMTSIVQQRTSSLVCNLLLRNALELIFALLEVKQVSSLYLSCHWRVIIIWLLIQINLAFFHFCSPSIYCLFIQQYLPISSCLDMFVYFLTVFGYEYLEKEKCILLNFGNVSHNSYRWMYRWQQHYTLM